SSGDSSSASRRGRLSVAISAPGKRVFASVAGERTLSRGQSHAAMQHPGLRSCRVRPMMFAGRICRGVASMFSYRAPLPFLVALALFASGLWAPPAEAAGVLQFREPRMSVVEGETHEITVIRSGSSSGEVTVVLNASLGG